MKNKFTYLSLVAAIFLSLFVSVSDVDAQNSRRKKKTRQQSVVSPSQTVPTVVSRNERYLDGNQIVLGELPQTETTGEVISPPTDTTTEESKTTEVEARIKELNARIQSLESTKRNEYDEKQKRLLLNLDILSRAESRAESLRKQLFEIIEKESSVRTRLEQILFDGRPETIDRTVAMVGSMRPEEIRDQRRKSLEAEKRNLELLISQIESNRATLQASVERADLLVEKVRFKLDKDIDDALADEKENK